jgi:hypothetical protein
MCSQLRMNKTDHLAITLEIVSENPFDTDPAMVDELGRETADALRKDGYEIKPNYTGQRGGFNISVLIPFLSTIWAQRDIILADGSALVTIFTPVVLIIKYVQEVNDRHKGKEETPHSTIKIAVEIDGASISIEAPDLETAEASFKLAQRFQAQHPSIAPQVTSYSNAKVKCTVD